MQLFWAMEIIVSSFNLNFPPRIEQVLEQVIILW